MAISLSLKQARRLALQSQGLLGKRIFPSGDDGAHQAIAHLGYVQIDPISIICRAHHHVLWNRCQNYQPEYLAGVQRDRKVFEYWSHAAAYLPMNAYRACKVMMEDFKGQAKHWFTRDSRLMTEVLKRIEREGPLFARDFTEPSSKKAIWSIGRHKQMLHELFIMGELMIVERNGIQKRFDLTKRVVPTAFSAPLMSKREFARDLVLRSLHAHGLVTQQEVAYLRKGWKGLIGEAVQALEKEGMCRTVEVEGLRYLTTEAHLDRTPKRLPKKRAIFLSPFDNAIIQRKRLQQLFGFSYQAEIYLPAAKRVYGYFAMPILWGDRFVGRIDPKADRKKKRLLIQNLMLEPEDQNNETLHKDMGESLRAFAAFNDCDEVVLVKKTPLNRILKKFL